MYIVTQEGHKLPVDTTSIPEDEFVNFQQNVGLYDDSTVLRDVWIVELNKKTGWDGRNSAYELEFVKELRYYDEPTKEQILWGNVCLWSY